MTTTTLAPPPALIAGTPAYAAAAAWLIAHTADVWATPALVAASSTSWNARIHVDNDTDAVRIAQAFGIATEPCTTHDDDLTYVGTQRTGHVDGITVVIDALWKLPAGEPTA